MEATGLASVVRELTLREPRFVHTRSFRAPLLLARVACLLTAALLACGLWLLVRRLSGAFGQPLNDAPIVAVAAASVLWAAAARLLWRFEPQPNEQAWLHRFMDWTPTVALVLIATSIALPGKSIMAIVLVCTLIALEECGASLLGQAPLVRLGRRSAPPRAVRSRNRLGRNGGHPAAIDKETDIVQELTRRRGADGREAIHGTLHVRFEIGQRTAIEHLVFCPMLAMVPNVSVAPLGEPDCAVRATHVYRYGARMEIKLPEPCDEPCDVVVRYNVVEAVELESPRLLPGGRR